MPPLSSIVQSLPSSRRSLLAASALALLVLNAGAAPTAAETLNEALLAAYQTNPRLEAARARLRATDESVPEAKAGFRPQASATADAGVAQSRNEGVVNQPGQTDGTARTAGYQINVRQSLFSGFRTVNGVRESEAGVRAGREELRAVEAQILLEAASAYADVIRDQGLVRLRENAVDILTRELRAAEARRAAREITRTDVAQTQVRRARAVSALDLARSNVKTSRSIYERVIGRPPHNISRPSYPAKLIPVTVDDAIKIAERESPNVIFALYREQAARHGVDRIWGELLPEVSIEASYGQRFTNASQGSARQDQAVVGGRVNIPLYEGGGTKARVRAAKHNHVSRIQEIEQARAEAQAQVVAAWSRLEAARAQIATDNIQIQAARTALEGVREEEKVGQRTLLDVLNAEQELVEAQITALNTQREQIVAAYGLLASMGRLNASELSLAASQYDPSVHYEEVRGKWFGVSITHADGRVELLEKLDNWGARDAYSANLSLRPAFR